MLVMVTVRNKDSDKRPLPSLSSKGQSDSRLSVGPQATLGVRSFPNIVQGCLNRSSSGAVEYTFSGGQNRELSSKRNTNLGFLH